jgi:hydrogenase maturation factor
MSESNQERRIIEIATVTGAYCQPDAHGQCITCGDEALPARVLQVNEAEWMAVVAVNGQTTDVDVSLVDEVAVGDVLLVHGGVALGRLEVGD